VRIELLSDAFLLPELSAFLTAEGLLVAPSDAPASLEVYAPDISSPVEVASRVVACANGWAALRGVRIRVDPVPDRIAHPVHTRPSNGSSRPTVSIGLPVHNGANFLAGTLDSLLAQTYADYELIVSDNASDDETARICESYAARDGRIRYLRSDVNRGAAWNYNRTLQVAEGRYFKWAAHDDLCAPTFLERCVEVLDRAPETVVLTYPKTVLIDAAGNLLGPYEDGLDLRQPEPHQRLRVLIRNLVMANAVFGLIRTDALRRTRGHGAYISADYVLLAELAMLGQFWEVPEPLFLRRDHPQMSRRAYRAPAELAEWFKAGARRRPSREFLRLSREYVSALERASDLAPLDRLRNYATLVPWLRRFHRSILRELLGPALGRPEVAPAPPDRVAHAERIERMNVHDVVRSVVWSIAPDYTPHVRFQIDPHLTVDADRAALDRVLLNLVSNAVRYGRGPITISAEANRDFVLTVQDQGRGVSPEFVPRLFEPFARSEESTHASPGLGLGLAIARMTADDCGGALTYEPAQKGARFRLTLPRPREDGPVGPHRKLATTRPWAASMLAAQWAGSILAVQS
jgi:signal transduction histidine kinase